MWILLGLLVLTTSLGLEVDAEPKWWQTMSLYQIYPRSYQDSDGDGIGDLKGITSRLQHLKDSNVDAFWLSPFYPSPMVDFGYDISNYIDVDPIFGTLADFEDLVAEAHALNISVILDFVPNHSSDKHEWFEKSVKNIQPYSDYYVWANGIVLPNGTVAPPNNWLSVFGGSGWEWNDERQAYYFHQFTPQQPDLNFNNAELVQEITNIMNFWLDRGVDGFRIDASPHIFEDSRLLDEPVSGRTEDPNDYGYLDHIYTKDLQEVYWLVQAWRQVLDVYERKDGRPRVMMVEAYADQASTMKYYEYGVDFPFNFYLIANKLEGNSAATEAMAIVDHWMSAMPAGCTANWVAGNHDNPRLASRFGTERAQAINALLLLLPGVAVTYYGDEIGMVNTFISWEDTVDPPGIVAGEEGYMKVSRDPERTPFQWDSTTSAGFSTNDHTWLPVNENYLTLNLEEQKTASDSFYKFYQDLSALRKWPALRKGDLTTRLLGDNVFAFSREYPGERSVYVVFNFSDEEVLVDLNAFDKVPNKLDIYRASVNSKLSRGDNVNPAEAQVPAGEVVIYVTPEIPSL